MKKFQQLSHYQRYEIKALLATGMSQTNIAAYIEVHKSTVSKELKRNSVHSSRGKRIYKPEFAQRLTDKRRQLRAYYAKCTYPVRRRITWLLRRGWSPEQISRVCKQRDLLMLSHEGIYLWVYEQKRHGADYCSYLRRGHRRRRKRRNKQKDRQLIKGRISIDKRPKIVDEQKRIGDFEVDLVQCKQGYLVTATDRKTLFNLFAKVENKSAKRVGAALTQLLGPYKHLIKTITSDNGLEFARHRKTGQALGVDWYFAHPYCSQQRGCNENQNGLLRQYAKRTTHLNEVSEETVRKWQTILNARPRKKLNFKPPKQQFLAGCSTVAFAP